PWHIPVTRTPSATPTGDVTAEPTPLGTIEWRPPPLPVPLSIHPDDHYWLTRPLPSGSRNYDLEWYPYGNDVLVPQYAPYRIHHGLDFPNPPGTQVLAASSGVVIWAGPRPSPRDGLDYYGNTIIIKHDWQWQGQDVYTLYAHTLEMFVNVGDYVEQGQLLAGVGASGLVSGPHLHFEVRVGENNYWDTRNPSLWIAPYEGWGTLAGRFIDEVGNPVLGADITVVPRDVNTPIRRQRTYEDGRLKPDEVWRENFVVGDLPAGVYDVFLEARLGEGVQTDYRRTIEVLPGRTNFMVVQGEFVFVPTPTPLPTVEPLITGTLGLTDTAVLTGTTTVFGQDIASGEHVHIADFSAYQTPGTGYYLAAAGEESHPFDITAEVYSQLKYDALAYFYHNRSGITLTMPYAGDPQWTRAAGHIGVAPNQGDYDVPCFDQTDEDGHQWYGCDYTLSPVGGWYDAGDHGKYVVNGGISLWTMLNQYERTQHLAWADAAP
ncbi:MAG: peptidoglycan DD-metalloendopeptidase family protein, partial [Anaerolineales bacterium]|nr:peptidoglycan DD-metalloendopeptidase family protein [Anaerolineales bacterium]